MADIYDELKRTSKKGQSQTESPTLQTAVFVEDVEQEISRLPKIIREMNESQKQLESIKKIKTSTLYRGASAVNKKLRKAVGVDNPQEDVYNLFQRQQDNVSQLNYILAAVVSSYEPKHYKRISDMDYTIDNAIKETQKRNELKERIPSLLEKKENAMQEMKKYDRQEKPKEYYSHYRQVLSLERELSSLKIKHDIAKTKSKWYNNNVDSRRMEEQLYQALLSNVAQTQVSANHYQEELEYRAELWRDTTNLAQAVSALNEGVSILTNYHNEMKQGFIASIRSIIGMKQKNKQTFDNCKDEMRDLLWEIKDNSYSTWSL